MTATAPQDYFGLTIPFMDYIGLVPEQIAPPMPALCPGAAT